jgi:hypothetical protein
MTPTRRRPATPASQGPTGTAPDVPSVAAPKAAPSAKRKDGTQLVGPEGEPLAQEARPRDAGGDAAPPTETGPVTSDGGAATKSRRRPGGLYPLPVWPD